jgi:hypothetical protein
LLYRADIAKITVTEVLVPPVTDGRIKAGISLQQWLAAEV